MNERDTRCPLCDQPLDGNRCPFCGEAMTDAQLHAVVGGMAVVSGIGLGLGLIRLAQVRRLRRELAARQ